MFFPNVNFARTHWVRRRMAPALWLGVSVMLLGPSLLSAAEPSLDVQFDNDGLAAVVYGEDRMLADGKGVPHPRPQPPSG